MAKQKKPYQSALTEQKGVTQPNALNTAFAKSFKAKRAKQPNVNELVTKIKQGNITALSQAITLVESTNSTHAKKAQTVITKCLPYTNTSIRIGITGVPGVGKSTFIEAFGNYITTLGKKVAVLAVDPSSSISKGSIMGDKTRMETLVTNTKAFIRPSPAGNSLGGVAKKTRESIILCEAAGFDVIIIETVGVGQSETAVHSMVDFFLLLKLAGAGDELQGIKRGIIEMADAIIINKADGNNLKAAKLAKVEFNRALHLFPKKQSGWQPKVALCSALKNEGITAIWQMTKAYITNVKSNNYFETNRKNQNKFWLLQTIEDHLKTNFYNSENIKQALNQQLQLIDQGKTTPFAAAKLLLSLSQ